MAKNSNVSGYGFGNRFGNGHINLQNTLDDNNRYTPISYLYIGSLSVVGLFIIFRLMNKK